jgi:hypothetical protein
MASQPDGSNENLRQRVNTDMSNRLKGEVTDRRIEQLVSAIGQLIARDAQK